LIKELKAYFTFGNMKNWLKKVVNNTAFTLSGFDDQERNLSLWI